MWNKAREILNHCINVIMVILLLGLCVGYVAINSLIMTSVINNFRLDTYLSVETGFGIVTLIILLGWAPFLMVRGYGGGR